MSLTFRTRRFLVLFGAAIAGAPGLFAVQGSVPPQGAKPAAAASSAIASFVMGRVIDGVTRAPIQDALVNLSPSGREPPPRLVTDNQGQFLFRAVPAGEYRLTATAPGYGEGGYGQSRPDAAVTRLAVSGDRPVGNIEIRLWKLGVVRGRIRDETGEPLTGIVVRAFRLSDGSSTPVGRPSFGATDDRGEYAIRGLAPGHYVVAVQFATVATAVPTVVTPPQTVSTPPRPGFTPLPTVQVRDVLVSATQAGNIEGNALARLAGPRPLVRPTVYFPAASNPADATVIAVTAGSTRTDADMTVRTVPSVFLSGTVVGGTLPAAIRLRRTDASDPLIAAENAITDDPVDVARTTTDASGRFTIVGVPPGEYVLSIDQIRTGPATANRPPAWARVPVSVGSEDVTGVTVPISPGIRARGRVVLDAAETDPAGLARMEVFMNSPGRNSAKATMSTGTTFSFEGLLPGAFTLFVNAPAGYVLGWIETGGRRMTARAIDIVRDTDDITLVVTKRLGRVEGELAPDQAAAGSVRILLFTADRAAWREAQRDALGVRATTLDQNGGISIASVPPGDYFIVAVQDDAFDPRWRDASTLGRLAATALRFTVAGAETQNVRVPVLRRNK